MKTLSELKTMQEEKVNQLIKEVSMFFAFSTQQFKDNKTPLKEGEKYVHLGAGCYIPKGQVDNYLNGMDSIRKWFKAEVKATKGMRKENIKYQLSNHEAWYTGTIDDTMTALGSGYTKKEVWTVWQEFKAVMQD